MKDNKDFSFIKFRDEIINKSGLSHNVAGINKELQKKLKFEPNLNITRNTNYDSEQKQINLKSETKDSNVMNINEISSRFSNKDSLNLLKKPLPKKDKKTILINAQSLLKPNVEQIKEKKENKGEDIIKAINNLKVKDPSAYVPTTLPFKNLEDESSTLELNENDLYLFQFPRILPVNLEQQKKIKDQELDIDEPVYDQSGFLIRSEFENIFKTLPNNSNLGKMKIYKSGKIKLQIGNITYDVTPGITCKFSQELGIISTNLNEAYLLGKIREKKLVVTPELNFK